MNSLWCYKTELYNVLVTRVGDEHSTYTLPLTDGDRSAYSGGEERL